MTKDKDHRRVANHILVTANKVVTTERGGQHGGAEDSFQMIADMWQVYLQNTNRERFEVDGRLRITPKDVAQMMVLLKIARNVHGALKEDDFVDQAGYTSLAAALAGLEAPELPKATEASNAKLKQALAEERERSHPTPVDPSTHTMAAKLAPRRDPDVEGDTMAKVLSTLEAEIKG